MTDGSGGPTALRLVAVSHTGLYSGAEIVLERVVLRAAAAGWSVSCCVPPGPMADRLRRAGVAAPVFPELKLPRGPRVLAIARAGARALRAARLLRREARNADVILVNGLLALPAVRIARLRSPVAWIVHDCITAPDAKALLRVCAPAVTVALPVSAAVAGPVEAAGITSSVIHNGTPWPVEPAVPDEKNPPIVGCNALLTSWKGQSVLLDAVAMLRRQDVEVELLGGTFPKDGPYQAVLVERAARDDLAGRVRFLGHTSDVLATMRRWTVAVSASVEPEAGPLSVLEAMSLGIPVVATAHGGAPEILGDAGMLVSPGDPVALAGALDTLLTDSALRDQVRQSGPAQVAAHFQLEAKLDEVLAALEGTAFGTPASAEPAAPAVPLRRRLRAVADASRVMIGHGALPPGAVVLAYHDVNEDARVVDDYSVTPARFRAQVRAAQRAGIRFVTLSALTDAFLAGERLDGLGAVVFDDGLVGVHHHALPILDELRVPATVFVVTDVVGSSPPWWPSVERTMTRSELEEVMDAEVRLAAHSRSHPSLPGLDANRLRHEILDSRKLLEDVVQTPVELFAYPFGNHDAAVRSMVAEAGYRAAYTFLNGRVVPGLDPLRLPRLTMGSHQGTFRLAYHLTRPADSWPDTQVECWPPTP